MIFVAVFSFFSYTYLFLFIHSIILSVRFIMERDHEMLFSSSN